MNSKTSNTIKRWGPITAAITAVLLAPIEGIAQSSTTSISFQVALNRTNGQPLADGTNYTLTFRFYSNAVGGVAIGIANVPGVTVSGGVGFASIPVQSEWFNGQTRYLGVTVQGVDNSQELSPRILVTAVPYAITAQSLGQRHIFIGDNNAIALGLDHYVKAFEAFTPLMRVGTGQEGSQTQLRIVGPRVPVGEAGICEINFQFADGAGSSKIQAYRGERLDSYLQFRTTDLSGSDVVRMKITADGKVGIGTFPDPQVTLDVGGHAWFHENLDVFRNAGVRGNLTVEGTTRTTVLQITSARAAKERYESIDPAAVLAKVVALPIATWAYTNSHGVRHLGPVAEDFHSAFGLGDSPQHIATVDADGVALAAIQGLHRLVKEQNARIADLEAASRGKDVLIGTLESRLTELQKSTETRLGALDKALTILNAKHGVQHVLAVNATGRQSL